MHSIIHFTIFPDEPRSRPISYQITHHFERTNAPTQFIVAMENRTLQIPASLFVPTVNNPLEETHATVMISKLAVKLRFKAGR